jgi:hypothetical protein
MHVIVEENIFQGEKQLDWSEKGMYFRHHQAPAERWRSGGEAQVTNTGGLYA